MEKNQDDKIIWIVAGVVIVLVIGFLVWNSVSKKDDVIAPPATDVTVVPQPTTEPESTIDGSGSVNVPASLSYANALIQYKDKRIQFDKTCQAFPNTVTYKDNTGIMLDNRSPNPRIIKVGTEYTIKGYGFRIITLPDIYLKAKTILVDCDKQQNVATILVQE